MPPKKQRQQKIKENKPTRRQLQKQQEDRLFQIDLEQFKKLRVQYENLRDQFFKMRAIIYYKESAKEHSLAWYKHSRTQICKAITKIVATELLSQYPDHDLPIIPQVRLPQNRGREILMGPPREPSAIFAVEPVVIPPRQPQIPQ